LYDARSVSKLANEFVGRKLALCDGVVAKTSNEVVVD